MGNLFGGKRVVNFLLSWGASPTCTCLSTSNCLFTAYRLLLCPLRPHPTTQERPESPSLLPICNFLWSSNSRVVLDHSCRSWVLLLILLLLLSSSLWGLRSMYLLSVMCVNIKVIVGLFPRCRLLWTWTCLRSTVIPGPKELLPVFVFVWGFLDWRSVTNLWT